MEKAMAPHSSTLAWKIPWMEEPGKLQSMGLLKSWTRLSDFTFTFHFHVLEKEMATHSSVLVWRIPGTGEPGGLPSTGSHRVRHDWSDLAAAVYTNIERNYIFIISSIHPGICHLLSKKLSVKFEFYSANLSFLFNYVQWKKSLNSERMKQVFCILYHFYISR